jgi:hypothetical protein
METGFIVDEGHGTRTQRAGAAVSLSEAWGRAQGPQKEAIGV